MLSRIRILHFIETGGLGGAETAAVDLAVGLSKDRFESDLASLHGGAWLEDRAKQVGIPFHVISSGGSFDWRLIGGLIGLMRKGKFDLLQTHLMDSNFYGSVAGFLGRFPVVAVEHGDAHHPGKTDIRKLKPKTIARLADEWVAVSKFTKDALVKRFNVPEKKVRVIPNGIRTSIFDKKTGNLTHEDLGLPEGSFVVGAVGSLYPVKGHRYLIEAVARVSEKHPNVHLVIAGDGKEKDGLIELSRNLGISDKVHLPGRRSDVPDLLKLFDVFVLPSESEAHPLSLCEAMASGLPVVASNVGGVPEVIENRKTGILTGVGDVEALAKAVSELIESSELRGRLGNQAVERIREEYSMERMLERYSRLYTDVLERRGKR